MKIEELKTKIRDIIYEMYLLRGENITQLIFSEKDILSEVASSASKIKATIESLVDEGILESVVKGYVPEGVVSSSQAVFTSQKSQDYQTIGYKLTFNQKGINKLNSASRLGNATNKKLDDVKFNGLTSVVSFGTSIHKFQRGEDKASLFKYLWEERRHVVNGKEIHRGEIFPPEKFAVQMNIAEDKKDFERNRDKREKFNELIKSINRSLKEKSIPAKIIRQNGIQLVVTV